MENRAILITFVILERKRKKKNSKKYKCLRGRINFFVKRTYALNFARAFTKKMLRTLQT